MISRVLTPTFRLSFGLVGITLSLIMAAFILGMFPDQEQVELKARGGIAEALALQLSSAASQHDTRVLTDTVNAVVARNPEVLSIALRRNDGKILLAAGDHEIHWVAPHEHRSSPTHVQVNLSDGKAVWGSIELSFTPLAGAERFLGVPSNMTNLMIFLAAMGFVGYYIVLRRALRELDPGNVIPDRVQSAFNSLAEGILILDERGIILLANDSFSRALGSTPEVLFGTNISKLKWKQWGGGGHLGDYPWQVATHDRKEVTGAKLSYQLGKEEMKNFVVNATCISGPEGRVSGVIATFDDVTELEQKNDDLEAAVVQLKQSEEAISKQNEELQYLASHDPLTGCLNRRAFFEKFAEMLNEAEAEGSMLTCMMADLDHFKNVNDTYGHAVGDQVIVGMADVLREASGETGLVGRYGGEEFCLVLPALDAEQSHRAAEMIRRNVLQRSSGWLQVDSTVTSSIGIALRPNGTCAVGDFVDWADQALYEAKETGRNKVVFWDAANTPENRAAEQQLVQVHESAASTMETATDGPPTPAPAVPAANVPAVAQATATDPFTGLPSELIFIDRVTQAISRADWDEKTVGILHVSLDAIEQMDIAYGEDICTEFITIIAARFKSALKRSDTISTLDGSNRAPSLCHISRGNFAVEISDLEETNTIIWIVKRLFDSLSAPITIKDDVFYASCNIGVSLSPSDGNDAETLMRNAASARLYAQEQDGKNNYQFFSQEMNRDSRRQMGMESSIRQAIDRDLFILNYQPIIDARTGEIEAMETLLRSEHPDFGGVPIGSLIAVAEQTGLIIEIGEWVLKNAIRQIHSWQSIGLDVPRISINLSAIQLNNKMAMERLMHILQRMQLPPSCLQFEVTETAILRDSESAAAALQGIKDLGVYIALDDFGTGQSSLGYLRRFKPDILKVDRCFIGEITSSHSDETLVSAIVSMAKRLDMMVVAEGVETQKQLEKVCSIGCDAIQGYYFARPMPSDQMTNWMRDNHGQNLVAMRSFQSKTAGSVA